MKPYEFSFDTIIDRAESTAEVHVVCRVEGHAQSVGFDEPCSQRVVSVIRTEYKGEPLTDDELNELHSQAMDQLCYHPIPCSTH